MGILPFSDAVESLRVGLLGISPSGPATVLYNCLDKCSCYELINLLYNFRPKVNNSEINITDYKTKSDLLLGVSFRGKIKRNFPFLE